MVSMLKKNMNSPVLIRLLQFSVKSVRKSLKLLNELSNGKEKMVMLLCLTGDNAKYMVLKQLSGN